MPTRDEVVARYAAAWGNRELPDLEWYNDDEVVRSVKPFNDEVFRLDGS